MTPLCSWNRRRRAVADANDLLSGTVKSASGNSGNNKTQPLLLNSNLTTLDELCFALRKQLLTELCLGWRDSVVIDFSKRRQVRRLVQALKCNSSLQHVQIGCMIRSRHVVTSILQVFGSSHCRSTLRTFQLFLHPELQWIPEEPLKSLLLQHKQLETIGLHGVHAVVLSKTPTGMVRLPPPHKESLSIRNRCSSDRSVISRIIVHLLQHERLKTLELTDCNVTDAQANQLADFLHVRAGVRVARLSLRLNKSLTCAGLRVLCQAPVMDQLDFSLCELDTMDIKAIAASIAKRPWPLRELIVCGNFQIETSGWVALTSRECCDKLTIINLSYSVVSCAQAVSILDSLERNLSPDSLLQEINLQGCRQLRGEGDTDLSESLCRLLRQSTSLRVVRLNDWNTSSRCRDTTRRWSAPELSRVLDALRTNYEMEILLYESWRCKREGEESLSTATLNNIRNDMDFVLRLNQAGRRILMDREQHSHSSRERALRLKNELPKTWDDEWFQVLEKAGKDDLDVLYWMVHECADRFGTGA